MARTTTINGFSVPQLTDGANIEVAVGTLADAIDTNVIARFANATNRNTAIPSPTAGMMTYRSDQDALEVYNGTNWILLNAADVATHGFAMSSGSDTTTSGTYVNLAGTGATTSVTVTKKSTGTRLFVLLNMSMYVTVGDTSSVIGVNVNSTDNDICTIPAATTANSHFQVAGFLYISGLSPANYTVQGRWKRTAGTGTLTRTNLDWFALSVREVK